MEREQLKQRLLGSSRSAHLQPHHICDDRSRFLLLLTWVPHSLGLCELTFSYLVGLYQTVCFFFFYPHTHTHTYKKKKKERPDACHGSIPVTLFFLPFFLIFFSVSSSSTWIVGCRISFLPLYSLPLLFQDSTNPLQTHRHTGGLWSARWNTHTHTQTERRRFYSPISSFYG